MDKQVFQSFRNLIYKETGITVAEHKTSWLTSRIMKRIRALHLGDEKQYLDIIESDKDPNELKYFINAITTNTTHFYREKSHFEYIRDVVFPRYAKENRDIKIWCAASSSGEEPYTIAMMVDQVFQKYSRNVKILATDISVEMLKDAVSGIYDSVQLRDLPKDLKAAYFSPITSGTETLWQISPILKKMVTYKRLNLIDFPWPVRGPVDMVFCRNVMIYFDVPTRQKIVKAAYNVLPKNGYLFLSLSEALPPDINGFRRVANSVFQKNKLWLQS